MPHFDSPRGTLYAADYRHPKTGAIPTLLIHGAGGTHLDMPLPLRRDPQLQAIAPDLAGHGRSSGPGHNSIEAYGLDLLALLDVLTVPQVNIIGHSMGGAIALTLALTAPERVARLILIGSAPRIPVNPRILTGLRTQPDETLAMLAKWMWRKSTPAAVVAASIERMQQIRAEVIVQDYVACDGFDVTAALSQLAAATLIIHGTQDRMIPVGDAQQMAAAMPSSTLLEYTNGGHMIHLEEPEAVTAAIGHWLAADY